MVFPLHRRAGGWLVESEWSEIEEKISAVKKVRKEFFRGSKPSDCSNGSLGPTRILPHLSEQLAFGTYRGRAEQWHGHQHYMFSIPIHNLGSFVRVWDQGSH